MDKMLTVKEVAGFLRLSRSQVYVLANRKEIPHTRIGKRIVIRESELMKWLTTQMVTEAAQSEDRAAREYARKQ